jgi:glycosyltransferase involved in cell wall biosynthesis
MKKKECPLVSVMMPVYNGESTIKSAIKSLLSQTYTNWLCVIVNDGSSDGTSEILKNYESDHRFKIINLPKNKGRGYARQVALENAEGEYLAYLDADDFYHFEKLEKQVSYLIEHPEVSLIACGIGTFDNNKKLRTIRGKGNNEIKKHNKNSVISGFSLATSLIRLDDAKQYKYRINLASAEDVDYFDQFLLGKEYFILNEVLYYYFEFGSTTSKKILTYYAKGIKSDLFLIQRKVFVGLIQLIKSIIKFIMYFLLLPVLGVDFFLKRRGSAPTKFELEEFKKTIDLLL